jgi:2',3'-cyclic-nucleotide 2'-phosphodiesterase (5'-nucleotidase family)
MRPLGRRTVALVGLLGTMALLLCIAAAGFADTLKTDVELTTKDDGTKEATLSGLIADAVRSAAKSDAAILVASFFNDNVTVPKGNFSAEDALKGLSGTDDTIFIFKLTGDQIKRALEHGLANYPTFNSGFLQVSGLTVTISPNADQGKRVASVKVKDEALDPGKTYRVAMPAPLARGTLGYFQIWKIGEAEKDTGITMETAVRNYLNDHKTIAKGEDRLVFKGK